MGVIVQYGDQKHWGSTGSFDGLKKASVDADFKYGLNDDFLFSTGNDGAAISYAGSTATATASVAKPAQASSAGGSNAVYLRKINGAQVGYGSQKFWIAGLTSVGLRKEDAGTQKYWQPPVLIDGLDIFPSGADAISRGSSTASASASVTKTASGSSAGSSNAVYLRKIGGAANPNGAQKHWTTGITFIGLRESPENNVKFCTPKFADQSLWVAGLPTPEIFPPFQAEAQAQTFVAKIISASYKRKRSVSGYPASVKTISAKPPTR
jgi:hypothetical protein